MLMPKPSQNINNNLFMPIFNQNNLNFQIDNNNMKQIPQQQMALSQKKGWTTTNDAANYAAANDSTKWCNIQMLESQNKSIQNNMFSPQNQMQEQILLNKIKNNLIMY